MIWKTMTKLYLGLGYFYSMGIANYFFKKAIATKKKKCFIMKLTPKQKSYQKDYN